MNRRNLLLAGLVAVAVLGGFAWLILRNHGQPEPVYQGKRLSKWLDGDDLTGTYQAVHQIGTNGLPTLLRMLQAHDSKFKLQLVGLAQKQHLIKIDFVAADVRRAEALVAIGLLGADASNAVPALIQIFEDRDRAASQELSANVLGEIGPAATTAVPLLLRTAADTNSHVRLRAQAIVSLGKIHTKPEFVVPVLIQCLKDPDAGVRLPAAYALGLLKGDAKAAIPALVNLLNDPAPYMRNIAEDSLKAIDPEAAAKAGVK